ncbi:MAG: nitrite/sulfite reductase [Lachnospiraceae bacterium]|nr:nitrite/sulfite reductase [Lachnospiraceae bacterium]
MQAAEWKKDYEEFIKVTKEFYAGNVDMKAYKGFSGGFGSYAQRGGKVSMLRLRMPGGRVDKEKLKFTADCILKYEIDKIHFTTCQTIQLHNLEEQTVCELAVSALDAGIITRGGGGDFPRNVMMSPLSGVEKEEYFDVSPFVEQTSEYLLGRMKYIKLPRKLKVGFSNSPKNLPHATFRDLGFAARKDGKFDIYSAGGLGNNPKMGVLVAQAVEGEKILYHVEAMIQLFLTYGNYENRAKARTRYMQDVLQDRYVEEYQKKLEAVSQSKENLDIVVEKNEITKSGSGTKPESVRVIAQKQPGLYAVAYHPIGGCPMPETFVELCEAIQKMEQVELRLAPDEGAYIINCTAEEAEQMLELTKDSARNPFETSVACIGASICQIGVRDSQKLLSDLIEASRKWNFAEGVLPQIHISGCPSSCGTHQIGSIGFRGGMKKVGGKPQSAFLLFVNGNDTEGEERFGEQLGAILEEEIPKFLKEIGEKVTESGKIFLDWYKEHDEIFKEIAKKYTE